MAKVLDIQKLDADGHVLATVVRFEDGAEVAALVAFFEAVGASQGTLPNRPDTLTYTMHDAFIRGVVWNR